MLPPRPRLVITGGRKYRDRATVYAVLDALKPRELAHGACPYGSERAPVGADWLADAWALANGLVPGETLRRYPAPWKLLGKRAGPHRNRAMLDDFRPDAVIAFPGGSGTADCVTAALERGIEVWRVDVATRRLVRVRRIQELRW